ncbi:unnamed protein product [Euphydryas editha]|uniref:Uncharacterized protein n=1 Tax=Euphydryas editha TaxID=104508 RepID=A0AAU9TSB1_EUPED|nr:unnamed protein product [Euphydryas editha]
MSKLGQSQKIALVDMELIYFKCLTAGGSDTTDPDAIFAVNNGTAATDTMVQPTFDNSTKREYTAAVGQPAYLHCRVKNLGDRSKNLYNLDLGDIQ